jgi:hypothetical protein
MPHYSNTILWLLVLFGLGDNTARAAYDLGFGDDSDLFSFVTRPEFKLPRFNVTVYDANAVTPGYWFLAPYAKIYQEDQPTRYYQACQTGPSIYDGAGVSGTSTSSIAVTDILDRNSSGLEPANSEIRIPVISGTRDTMAQIIYQLFSPCGNMIKLGVL